MAGDLRAGAYRGGLRPEPRRSTKTRKNASGTKEAGCVFLLPDRLGKNRELKTREGSGRAETFPSPRVHPTHHTRIEISGPGHPGLVFKLRDFRAVRQSQSPDNIFKINTFIRPIVRAAQPKHFARPVQEVQDSAQVSGQDTGRPQKCGAQETRDAHLM